jgi:SAM-dependent methyltransferase
MAIEASLHWQSPLASHCDRLLVADNALMADGRWTRAAEQVRGIADAQVELDAAPWLQPSGQAQVEIPISQFRLPTQAVAGRFYPRMGFVGLAQSPRDMRPVRVLQANAGQLQLDPNHPLAALGEKSGAKLVFTERAQTPTRGVRMLELFDGPGMQVPADDTKTTFLQPPALSRKDGVEDTVFYGKPRLTHHLDAVCRTEITALYRDFLQPGMRVLDLMSSWVSHLPVLPEDLQVAGLGMNAAEMAANPRLTERVVQDLNQQPALPWPAAQFDRVICTASIEYLTDPVAVLSEVRRVLKPGGQLIVTFSDRWFPTKAIQVWNDLHPFERLGLVLSLLRDAGFGDLHSETRRGLARPEDDKYIENRLYSDPLFAAWGVA